MLVACACVLAPTGSAAPVPKHLIKEALYYPVASGAKWEYEDKGRPDLLLTSTVEARGGTWVVTVGTEERYVWVLEVSPGVLVLTGDRGAKMDVPRPWLKAPIRVGNSWELRTAEQKTWTIGAVEKVTVPAGTFEAVRVDHAYTVDGQERAESSWFAPGVGLVKMSAYGCDWWVLKSFTPGK
ncbi:MAG: hypothetical protein K2V38_27025 [Gemmataceae bacterium]|nr:hypothetical protein [Gemmataceae bacterium]